MNAARDQRSDHTTVKSTDKRVAGQWAGAGRAAHQLVKGETQPAAHDQSYQDAKYHVLLFLRFTPTEPRAAGRLQRIASTRRGRQAVTNLAERRPFHRATPLMRRRLVVGPRPGDDTVNLRMPAEVARAVEETELAGRDRSHEAPATIATAEHSANLALFRFRRPRADFDQSWRERGLQAQSFVGGGHG